MAHTATWQGKTIAESDRTLEVGGYMYFPRDTVRMDLLKSTPKTAITYMRRKLIVPPLSGPSDVSPFISRSRDRS